VQSFKDGLLLYREDIIGILSISKDSSNLGGGIRDISNISINREEVVYEVEHLPPWGKGPPFLSLYRCVITKSQL
jgi:hypothetical protein